MHARIKSTRDSNLPCPFLFGTQDIQPLAQQEGRRPRASVDYGPDAIQSLEVMQQVHQFIFHLFQSLYFLLRSWTRQEKCFGWQAKVVHYWKVRWKEKRFIMEKYFGTKSFVDICACQQRNTTEPQQITLLQQTIGVIARSPFLSLALGLWINLLIYFISTYINYQQTNTKDIESSFPPPPVFLACLTFLHYHLDH